MAEQHIISALSNKRAELAGLVSQLERQLVQQQANLAHLDATMRLSIFLDFSSRARISVR
jgi:hypothetical protein